MTSPPPYCQGPDWTPRKSTKEEGTCGACGAALTGRRTCYCSSECSDLYGANHFWGEARRAAIRRDEGKCRRCGEDAELRVYYSTRFGTSSYRQGPSAEVNHIVPRDGAGYGNGCHNHQDNLETLCHKCHLLTTAEQRGHVPGGKQRARRAAREERDLAKLRRWEEWATGDGLQEIEPQEEVTALRPG